MIMQSYRSDVIGSLLRPVYLKQAREQREAGAISPPEFKRIEDRAANEALDLQTRAELDVVTDGEMRRYAFYGHFIDSVEGFDKYGGWAIPFHDEQGNELVLKRPVVVGRLRRIRPMCTEEFAYARTRSGRPLTMTPKSRKPPMRRSSHIWPISSTSCEPRLPSSCVWAAPIFSSTRRSTPDYSIPRSAKATASAAPTPTNCS